MQEIVYRDCGNGVFAPELTPAQKRAETLRRKRRAESREEWREAILSILGVGLAIAVLAVIMLADLTASSLWWK